MYSRTVLCVVLLVCVAAVLGDDPNTVAVGYQSGGTIGFQSVLGQQFYLSNTPSGALVVNSSPRDTVVEITTPSSGRTLDSLVEEYDEFGTLNVTSKLPSVGIAAKPPRANPEAGSKPNDFDIPKKESSFRTHKVAVEKVLSVREHNGPVDTSAHPLGGGSIVLSNAHQWSLVALDDFSESAAGWFKSGTKIALNEDVNSCGTNPDKFLGGYCHFSDLEASKTFTNLPPHSFVQVTARVHFFDKWQGEMAYAKVDGTYVWTQSHFFCSRPFASSCKGVDTCGDNKYSDKMSQLVSITLPHSGSSLTVSFGSNLQKDACVASWAVDDVAVWVQY